ncbi:hypothetical protein [Phascolarctobacterium sp.]|uniref:hypothetical protein n=1 Tax=Phascolarctobacterium sp. TaxID=2049039 RepID=UPI0025EA50C9|nr:hypothetical protein [Phascolarctobacterium sp.]
MPVFLWFVSFTAKRNEHLKRKIFADFLSRKSKAIFTAKRNEHLKKSKTVSAKAAYKKENQNSKH